ncbi:MAG: hypothetical protein U0X91_26525 [Spirosomataceae bacterium]
MTTYFWINIHCEKFWIKASNQLLDEWDKPMNYTQNLFNRSFQNFKLKTKGIRNFSVLFAESEEIKTSLPLNPLGDTAWTHHRYIDEVILKSFPTMNQKMVFIADEAYASLKLLCLQKDIPKDTFEDSVRWVKNHLAIQ